MNSYLKMSYTVLSQSRSPLSASEILAAAYRLQLVPEHLFGKTQHKTLHARLSEEILKNSSGSAFVRTAAGRFALKDRVSSGLVQKRSSGYIAPQRSYQLKQFGVVCAESSVLDPILDAANDTITFAQIALHFKRQSPLRRAERLRSLVYLRLLVVLRHEDKLLTLTAVDGAETGSGRSFGLLGYIKAGDADLFSEEPLGIDTAARRTITEQTSFPKRRVSELRQHTLYDQLRCTRVANAEGENADNSIVLLAEYECDDAEEFLGFVPASRAPRWTRVPAEINDVSSLEPVS
jgi:hypothetical protein